MRTGFKDRTEIKKQSQKHSPINGKNSPFDFRCPQYDERSSSFINAGTCYGSGTTQPVGTEKQTNTSVIPMGKVNTLSIKTQYHENY